MNYFKTEEFENSPKEKYDNKDLKKEKSNEEDKPRMVMAEEAAINEAEYAENTDDDDEEATVEVIYITLPVRDVIIYLNIYYKLM